MTRPGQTSASVLNKHKLFGSNPATRGFASNLEATHEADLVLFCNPQNSLEERKIIN